MSDFKSVLLNFENAYPEKSKHKEDACNTFFLSISTKWQITITHAHTITRSHPSSNLSQGCRPHVAEIANTTNSEDCLCHSLKKYHILKSCVY